MSNSFGGTTGGQRRGVGERLARTVLPRLLRGLAWSAVVRWDRPLVTRAYLAVHPEFRSIRLTRATSLVIDGHSRCANTYAVCAFEQDNRGARVTHHLHNPRVIRRALRLGVPTLLLIRRPEDVVASMLAFEPTMTVGEILQTYVDFYTPLLPVLDRLVVADFDEVIADFGAVVRQVNSRFGTAFAPYVKSEEAEAAVFAAVERFGAVHYAATDFENRVSRPSSLRHPRRSADEWTDEDWAGLTQAGSLYEEVLHRRTPSPVGPSRQA